MDLAPSLCRRGASVVDIFWEQADGEEAIGQDETEQSEDG